MGCIADTTFCRAPRMIARGLLMALLLLACAVGGVAYGQRTVGSERSGKHSAEEPSRLLDHALRCKNMGLYIEETEALEQLKRMSGISLRQRVICLYELSFSYSAMGVYELSLNNLFGLLRLEKPDSLHYFDISAKTLLAGTYMRFHAVEQADSVLDIVEKSIGGSRFPEHISRNLRQAYYLERSTICAERGDWQGYFDMLKMSDRYAEKDDRQQLRRILDYGIYYMQTGDTRMAEEYFKRLQERPEWSYDKMAGMTNYAEMLLNMKRDADCERVATETLSLMEGHRMDQMKSSLLLYKGLALSRLGKTAEAVPLLEESRQIRDSIFEWHTTHSVLGSAKEFERELANEGVADMMRTNRDSRIAIWCLSVLAAVLSGLIGWGIYRARRQAAARKELQRKLALFHAQQADDICEAKKELSDSNRRVVGLALKFAQINNLVRNAVDTHLSLDDADRMAQLREGIKSLDINRNVWETFNILFEQTHPDLYRNLRRLHPDLTKGELRMCAFVMMNLSTKEISAITNRSTRTVETVKYRLRKKLNLPDGTALTDYLHQVSGGHEVVSYPDTEESSDVDE